MMVILELYINSYNSSVVTSVILPNGFLAFAFDDNIIKAAIKLDGSLAGGSKNGNIYICKLKSS